MEQQAVDWTTFRPQASSGKRNESYNDKAHEFMKKNGESDVRKIGDNEL